MDNNIKEIQKTLMNNLERLDNAEVGADLGEEVSRSNAISQLANTYIKTCNLVIRVEESKIYLKDKLGDVIKNEK